MSIENIENDYLISLATYTFESYRPSPRLSLSEFCNANLKLSSEYASSPGNYRYERCFYQKEILDTCGDPSVKTVTLCTAAQIGKSVILQGLLLYYLKYKPSPILVLLPDLEQARTFSIERVTPMIRDSGLMHLVSPDKSRDSKNTILKKTLSNGSILNFVGAQSPAGLASKSVRLVLADEISRFPASAGTEGDPLALATKRTTTFHDAKHVFVSTPTDEECRIWKLYLASDQRTYRLRCVHCEEHFKPTFELIQWDKTEDGKHLPETARLVCPHCGALHSNAEKNQAVRHGVWIKENPDSKEPGFHLNSISSPFVTLEYMVREFLESQGDVMKLKKFLNTDLGEVFKETTEAVDNLDLISRVEPFDIDSIPNNVSIISGGVDCQRDRIEFTRMGHGPNNEKYIISHDIFHGDVTTPAPWAALKEALEYVGTRQDGVRIKTLATAIDSGDGVTSDRVYSFVNAPENARLNLRAIKGSSIPGKPLWPIHASQSGNGKSKVYIVGSDTGKDCIYSQLKITEPGHGYIHFSDTLTAEYFHQLTVEKKVLRFKGGRSTWVWTKKDRDRNETLDTATYALCMFAGLNRRPEAVQRKLQKQNNIDSDPIVLPQATPAPSDPIKLPQSQPQEKQEKQPIPIQKKKPKFTRAVSSWV